MRRALLFALLSLSIFISSTGHAVSTTGFRRGFAVVAFAGIGGAILGLSTLSFYGTPSDHTGNITTGFFLGVAGGLGYLVVDSAQSQNKVTSDAYGLIDSPRCRPVVKMHAAVPIFMADF